MMAKDAKLPAPRSVLLDSNLLLLYLIGLIDPKLIESYKRTKKFGCEDFDILKRFVDQFSEIITTAGILAETSNLGGALNGFRLKEFRLTVRRFVELAQESYQPAIEIVSDESFGGLGFTDTDILKSATTETMILTDDFDLYGRLVAKRIQVMNFTHLRSHLLSGGLPFKD